jgi:membrane-associated phospholipid phosphatase
MKRIRRLLVLFLGMASATLLPAQLSVSLVPDAVAVSGAASLAAISLEMPPFAGTLPLDFASINGFDRALVLPYGHTAATVSDVSLFASMALPFLLALAVPQDQALAAGVIYLEVMGDALFAKNAGKYLFPRVRPWVYREAESGTRDTKESPNDSFPSGHATMAFAASSFGITVALLELPPDSPWRAPFIAASAGIAALTAGLRVAAGMHFVSDVLAGAALGSVIGVVLPLAHSAWAGPVVGSTAAAPRLSVPLLSLSY